MTELLVALAVTIVLLGLMWPLVARRNTNNELGLNPRVTCMVNLREISTAMVLMTEDNQQKSFIQHAQAQSGKPIAPSFGIFPTVAGTSTDELWKLYLVLHPYLKNPYVLRCPSDTSFKNSANQTSVTFSETNVLAYYSASSNSFSYFLAVDAKMGPASTIVAGESHLSADHAGTDEAPGQLELKGEKRIRAETAKDLRWTKSRHAGLGVIAFGDGHAEVLTSARLRTVWANPTNQGTRIWLPN